MIIYIAIDDTDNHESRGTGRLARGIAADLERDYRLLGVTRHQLLVDPLIPYTAKNSSATITLEAPDPEAGRRSSLEALFARVRALMEADFQPGSDPGLCIAAHVPLAVTAFGQRAQREVLTQAEARQLADQHGILLQGLGGTEGGVIGALASVGLAASGEDGRYIMVGRSRELSGVLPIQQVIEAGINQVQTLSGELVNEGLLQADKLRPARRNGQAVQVVDWQDGVWAPVKLD
jgi:tRNA(Ile2) C34 agmatinyltransferase TiaS